MNGNNPGQQPRTLAEAEETEKIFDALIRLESNPDFKIVFEDHLFTNEVIRLHSLLAHPEQSLVSSRDRILQDLDALSNIKFALQMVKAIGSTTKEQLGEYREAELTNSEGE